MIKSMQNVDNVSNPSSTWFFDVIVRRNIAPYLPNRNVPKF